MNSKLLIRLGIFASAMSSICAPASALSLTGTFSSDDQMFTTKFIVPGSTSELTTLRTFSYAGGIDALGQTVAEGGFDPIVSLYNATGTLVGLSDDGIGVPADALSGVGADSLLSISLAPGVYQVVLTENDNFPNGDLSTGFSEAGNGDFTAGWDGCSASKFCDSYGFARTGNWSLDISAATPVTAAVPEPSGIALTLAGLMLIAVMTRTRRQGINA